MPYQDGTEQTTQPKWCPLCKEALTIRWVGVVQGVSNDKFLAVPVFVCLSCQCAARVCKLPNKTLRETRKAARGDARRSKKR